MNKQKNWWLVPIVGSAMMLFSGVPSSWGVFRKAVSEEYGFGQDTGAFVLNLTVAAFGVGCVIGGYLQDKKGAFWASIFGSILLSGGFAAAAFVPQNSVWLFYLVFCIPAGIGCAFLYPAVMSCIQKSNPEKKGLVTGIAGLGFGLSGLAITLAKQLTEPVWGIRGSFLTLAVLVAVICGGGSFFMKSPQQNQTENTQQKFSPKQVVQKKQYRWLFLAVCFAAPSVLLFSPKIVEMAQERDVSEQVAVWIVAVAAVFNALGRLTIPAISDKAGRKPTAIGGMLLLAGFSVAFGFVQGWWFFAGYCILCFFYSGNAALLPSFCTDLFGNQWVGVTYGLAALGMTAGSLLSPLLAKWIQGEYAVHWIAAISALLAVGCYYKLDIQNSQQKN